MMLRKFNIIFFSTWQKFPFFPNWAL